MFLFSTTFFPLSVYPEAIRWLVRLTPLYHAIELLRSLLLGTVDGSQLLNFAYLVALGLVGVALTRRRFARMLLK